MEFDKTLLAGSTGMMVLKLLEQDGNAYVWVPNGANGMFLCGDPYFEAVYELI